MALKEKIAEDLKSAMKAGNKIRLETLRTLRAALQEKEIELRGGGKAVSPDDELAVLTTAAKKRRESIELFEKGGRKDLVEQEKEELSIIHEYLPQQMSEKEIEMAIAELVTQLGATGPADFGKVMPQAMRQLKGKADGRLVQELVRKRLGAG